MTRSTALLTPALKRLAAQLVHERQRRDAWAASAELRRELSARLAKGTTVEVLTAELHSALAEATCR
jgi:hypothetical protein